MKGKSSQKPQTQHKQKKTQSNIWHPTPNTPANNNLVDDWKNAGNTKLKHHTTTTSQQRLRESEGEGLPGDTSNTDEQVITGQRWGWWLTTDRQIIIMFLLLIQMLTVERLAINKYWEVFVI